MTRKQPKRIGLAIVGAGRVGLIRGELAARYPQGDWIGLAELNAERGRCVAERGGAACAPTSCGALLKRPWMTAVVVPTDEHLPVDPVMAALERKLPMMI